MSKFIEFLSMAFDLNSFCIHYGAKSHVSWNLIKIVQKITIFCAKTSLFSGQELNLVGQNTNQKNVLSGESLPMRVSYKIHSSINTLRKKNIVLFIIILA